MNEWTLTFDGWDPAQEPLREALCTLGNGYFATRGAFEEMPAGEPHYPGTYLAGGYNRLPSLVAGRIIENEDLVNWPNWLSLTFRPRDGDWLDVGRMEILSYGQSLDLRRGVLERRLRVRDAQGRDTALVSRRIVSMADPHLAAIQWTLTPENWSGPLEIRSALDGTVVNAGVRRYRHLNGRHLRALDCEVRGDLCDLLVESTQSAIRLAQAARTRVWDGARPLDAGRSAEKYAGYAAEVLALEAHAGRPLRVEKTVALYTSRDQAISEPRHEARRAVRRAGDFAAMLSDHERAWQRLWARFDIEIERDDRAQLILRVHVFHLNQTVCLNSIDLDVGVPARGLHGEAYRGHIFWDELFIFPFFNLRAPEITRSLLRYRYRRLDEARRAARESGFAGALFPWQSGSDGREESQRLHLNPKSGRWLPDNSRLQYHINSAIAYNVWQYYQATEDRAFLSFYGAEMIVETARFWASIATWDPQQRRYAIRGVMGPDEYHDAYPGAEAPGLDNNAYTNVMAVWTLRCALDVLDALPDDRRRELLEELGITAEELTRFDDVSRRMIVPFHDGGIISQFEGYESLEEFDWEGARARHGDIRRLDRVLEAEDDSPNRYQVAKQADVLMLFYLLSAEELQQLFARLGYDFDPEMIPRNIEYYLRRTAHGSTLSGMVHSWVLARLDRERSWKFFAEALESDVGDVQGGTTPEGIHLGAMAGTVDIVQRCYLGLEMREDALWLNPSLPDPLSDIQLAVRYRGHWLRIRAGHKRLTVSFYRGRAQRVAVGVRDTVHVFEHGETRTFEL